MKKKILNILKNAPSNTLSQKELIKRLKARKRDVGAIMILIREMSNQGEIIKLKAKRYCLPNIPKKTEGKLSVTQKGFGFVITNDENEDIFIGRRSMADAINGDKVLVKIKGRSKSRGLSGRIHKVLERGSNTFIGVTYFYGGKIFIEISPVNPGRGIRLIGSKKELSEGKIVKARVKDWGNANNPIIASFESIIGNANDPANDLKMILHKYDYNQSFPSSINQEVNKYSEDDIKNEIKNRLDLRKEICFTIDPDEAKDFDDALSIKKNKMGTKIGVHIADVSHFVTPSSLIDKEAMNRGTSVYFTEGVVHMLPKELSADLCSIRPGVDRLAVSAIIQLNHNYKVLNVDILPTVINSKARFTYQEVQNIIEGKNTHAFKAQINDLKKLSIALYKERSKNGSLDFDIPEPIFEMNDKGVPHEIRSSERLISHRIVEECMLLANKVVAVEIPKKIPKKLNFFYRVHIKPDSLRVERFAGLLKRLKLGVYIPDGDMSPNDFKKILKHVEDSPYRSLIENVALRTMSKAEYAIKNKGHFGLAFRHYTHFTSPIRRYPDLLVHRMIKMLDSHSFELKNEWNDKIEDALKLSNEKEIEALNAEREYIKIKQLRWLADRINSVFEGAITGVTNFGFFVGLKSSMAEGLVHMDTLENDEYYYDEDHYCIKGRSFKEEFRLGDRVHIKIVSVQIEKQRANFALHNQS